MTQSPRILIIVGAARSGSTLAGLLLGQSGHFAYAGELNHMWDRGLGLNHMCGCGQHFADCSQWQNIVKQADLDTIDGVKRFAQLRRLLASRYSINPLRKNSRQGVANEDAIRKDLRALYETVAQTTERTWVLDGAKQPIYARLLIDIFGAENVDVVHLVRDPRGVAHSAAKTRAKTDTGTKGDMMVKRSPLQSAIAWMKLDASARKLRREAGGYHLIRYEDICTEGPELIADLLAKLGLENDPERVATAEQATTHTISGNPIRMGGVPQNIVADEAWRRDMSLKDQLIVSLICLNSLIRHGYLSWAK